MGTVEERRPIGILREGKAARRCGRQGGLAWWTSVASGRFADQAGKAERIERVTLSEPQGQDRTVCIQDSRGALQV